MLAWIVLVVAGLFTLLFAAVAIDNDGDPDLIFGGLILGAVSVAVALVAWFVQRRLRERRAAAAAGDAPADVLLARAEAGETVDLRPSRLKWSLMLLGSLLFSIFFVPAAIVSPHPVTIGGALLFGLALLASIGALLPGLSYMRVSPQGLDVKALLRRRVYAWDEVESFRVFEVSTRYSTQRFVGFDLRARITGGRSTWQKVDRGISGVDDGLPDNYGMDPERLAAALNRLHARYAAAWRPEV